MGGNDMLLPNLTFRQQFDRWRNCVDFYIESSPLAVFSLIMGRDLHPMSLHFVMFIPTIQGQTDDQQLDEWLSLAIARGIIGTYAQTELGHGSSSMSHCFDLRV